MRQHYGLDRLTDYLTEDISDPIKVVNPAHRELDGEVRKKVSFLTRKLAKFGALSLEGSIDVEEVEAYAHKKSELQEQIIDAQKEVELLKVRRKNLEQHIPIEELPEEHRFQRLSTQAKHLVDTIKMISYRAETSMAHTIREEMSHHDDARSLLQSIYKTSADLIPDKENGTLTVRIHSLANPSSDKTLRYLCDQLNETETEFPGTKLRIIYDLVSSQSS